MFNVYAREVSDVEPIRVLPGAEGLAMGMAAKFTAGALENVGWCLPGTRNEYNICMMEELHPVLSLGAGGVTKAVGAGCVRRLANPKYPQEYLRDLPRILREKEQLATFLTP